MDYERIGKVLYKYGSRLTVGERTAMVVRIAEVFHNQDDDFDWHEFVKHAGVPMSNR